MTDLRSWRLTFWYPRLPLTANDRRHRMVVYRVQKQIRDRVREEARRLGIPRLDSIHVEMTWTPTTNRGRDQDNAVPTLKSAIDGLRDYKPRYRNVHGRRVMVDPGWTGVIADDTDEFVSWSRPKYLPANPDPLFTERLVLIVTEGARRD
jgi:hypothetical protein